MFVPGIGLLLCVPVLIVLTIVQIVSTGDTSLLAEGDPRIVVVFLLPLGLVLPAIPMLALGGTLRAHVDHAGLEVVRVRAGIAGERVHVPLCAGPIAIRMHVMGGHWSGLASLTCTTARGETVLVSQANKHVVGRIAADLAGVLGGAARLAAAETAAAR